MKIVELEALMEKEQAESLRFTGDCDMCGNEITIIVARLDEKISIDGGALFHIPQHWQNGGGLIGRCPACFEKEKVFSQKCEVYSRVVVYLRPVNNWNDGKKEEFGLRKSFDLESL